MAHFEVGKKVICIKSHSLGLVKKGQVFELIGIKKGCCNSPLSLDVNIRMPAPYHTVCCICNKKLDTTGIILFGSPLFAPYDDSLSETTVEELIQSLELQEQ